MTPGDAGAGATTPATRHCSCSITTQPLHYIADRYVGGAA